MSVCGTVHLGTSRCHRLNGPPNPSPGARLRAVAAQPPKGLGRCPPTRPSWHAEGAWGAGRQPLRAGPSRRLLAPTAPSPTALFPAHPAPGDASDVTANNLDFNQEIALPPLPHLWSHRGENPDCSTRGRPQALPAETCCALPFPILPLTPPGRRRQGDPWMSDPLQVHGPGPGLCPRHRLGGRFRRMLVGKPGHGQGRGAIRAAWPPIPSLPSHGHHARLPWKTQAQRQAAAVLRRRPQTHSRSPNTSPSPSAPHSGQGPWPHWRETSGDWGPLLAPWWPTVGH